SKITNLDMAHFAEALGRRRDLAEGWRDFLECFLAEAAKQRFGPSAALVKRLASLGLPTGPSDVAQNALRRAELARRLIGVASNEVVFSLGGAAAEQLSSAISARFSASDIVKSVLCKTGSGAENGNYSQQLLSSIGVKVSTTQVNTGRLACLWQPNDDLTS